MRARLRPPPLLGRVALAATLCGLAVTLDMLRHPIGRQFHDGIGHLALLLSFYWLLRLGEQAADAGAVAPALAMWGPCFALAALGLGAGGRGPAYEIGSIPGKK